MTIFFYTTWNSAQDKHTLRSWRYSGQALPAGAIITEVLIDNTMHGIADAAYDDAIPSDLCDGHGELPLLKQSEFIARWMDLYRHLSAEGIRLAQSVYHDPQLWCVTPMTLEPAPEVLFHTAPTAGFAQGID